MSASRIVVTGGNGVMGRALSALVPDAVTLSRDMLDVRNRKSVRSTLAALAPDVVIHAAALTDHQTKDFGGLIATNVIGTENVVAAAKGVGAALVYLSTHYVYPGEDGGYTEGARTEPIGAYAWSKLAGEHWVTTLLRSQRYAVVRGSWYDDATRLRHWARRGAVTNAWCSREPVAVAARKIVAIARAVTRRQFAGVINIGGPRRSFADILCDEGYTGFPCLLRAELDARIGMPYVFPKDVSVDTTRFEALGLDW